MTTSDLHETMSTLRAVRELRSDPIPADMADRGFGQAWGAPK